MNTLRLLWVFFRVSVLNETAYRVNFFIQLFQSLLELGTALAGLAVIFSYTQALGGWRPDEMLALVGVYFLVGGLISLVIQPGMSALIDSVRDGTLDFTLTKPEDAQLLVSIQRVAVWSLLDLLMGVGVLVTALVRLGNAVGFGEAATFTGMLLAGGVIVYSFWLILASLSFWLVRVENLLEIFQSVYQAGRWPISLYPNWLRFGLTFIVPVAFATTIPAEALTGRLGAFTLLEALGLAILLFASLPAWSGSWACGAIRVPRRSHLFLNMLYPNWAATPGGCWCGDSAGGNLVGSQIARVNQSVPKLATIVPKKGVHISGDRRFCTINGYCIQLVRIEAI